MGLFFSKQSGSTRSYGLDAGGTGSKHMTQAMQEFRPDPANLHLGEIKCFEWYIKALLTLMF